MIGKTIIFIRILSDSFFDATTCIWVVVSKTCQPFLLAILTYSLLGKNKPTFSSVPIHLHVMYMHIFPCFYY